MLVFLLSVLGIFLQSVSANTSSCSVEDLRTCRADAITQMSSSGNNAGREERHCRDLRENFDCMLWQTSMCTKKDDQDSNSDLILKTWRYLEGFCEKYGNWWANSCFQRDDIKRCESHLPSKRNSLDSQSCSMYLNFRECVSSIVGSSCSSSDRSLLGTYLMEKGQQMAWRCPRDDDYGSASAASAQQVDRRYPEMYGDSASSSLGCTYSARNELNTCQTKYRETQEEAQRRDDGDMRNHKQCCGLYAFGKCIEDAIEKKCGGSYAGGDMKKIVDTAGGELGKICEKITKDSCNGANGIAPVNTVAISFLLYFVYFIYVKFF